MRAMQYKYTKLFFYLVMSSVLWLTLMAAAAMTETLRAVALLIPFFTIYIGVLSAYYLTYTFAARVYATSFEQQVNRALGRDVLIAHRVEAARVFPLGSAQFAGVVPRIGQTYIGFITIHFWLTGAVAIALSAYRAWQILPEITNTFPPARFYFHALIVWSLFNLLYLVWYFAVRRYDRVMIGIVSELHGTNFERA